jgi:hypothetical protein
MANFAHRVSEDVAAQTASIEAVNQASGRLQEMADSLQAQFGRFRLESADSHDTKARGQAQPTRKAA